MYLKINFLVLFCCCLSSASAWDSEELEIFDLVEEVNKNFYEFMGISQVATSNEIKRAFRNLSIKLHPDKSDAEDANIQFRNLVAIYDVLKDPGKREKYNKVLKDGLPNWKSALYYYRRMRKIGLYEGMLIVFVIITIGQYLFSWAAYLEKQYTAQQIIGSKLKKLQKKGLNVDTILNEIPKPSMLDTLPIQIPLAIWNLPKSIKNAFLKANELKKLALEKKRLEAEEALLQQQLEKKMEEQARLRKEQKENLRKRKQNAKAPEKTEDELRGYAQIQARELTEEDAVRPAVQKAANTLSGGFWTDDDLNELIRLVKKYPSGSGSRWNTIAESMNRTVQEVTFMAAKMKDNGYKLPGQATESVAENLVQQTQEVLKKEKLKKTADNNIIIPETNWSQEQQRALEAAIVKYRKTAGGDRWQKIANSVPEKTKEECLVRYKYLCELVKTQKKAEEEEQQQNSSAMEDMPEETGTEFSEEQQQEETATTVSKKRSKRKERRRRRDLSSGEDSDDAYQYELN